jgi:hypothetical protein
VRKADLAEKGDEDIFRKVRKDFDEKGVQVTDPSCAPDRISSARQ